MNIVFDAFTGRLISLISDMTRRMTARCTVGIWFLPHLPLRVARFLCQKTPGVIYALANCQLRRYRAIQSNVDRMEHEMCGVSQRNACFHAVEVGHSCLELDTCYRKIMEPVRALLACVKMKFTRQARSERASAVRRHRSLQSV